MSDAIRHIEVDGHRIAVASHNEQAPGIPLVVLHGVLLSLNIWPHALPENLRARRWYALGLPAHYPSLAPTDCGPTALPPSLFGAGLLSVIRALVGEQPFTLLGHSTGGYAALAIAAAGPGQVHAVCAVAPFVQGRWHGIVGLLQAFARVPVVGSTLFVLCLWLMSRSVWIARVIALFATTRPRAFWHWPPLPAVMAAAVGDLRRGQWRALARLFAQIHHHDIRSELAAIQAPVLVVHGSGDPIVPFDQAKLIQRLVSRAQIGRLDGIGHLPFAESGDAYARLLEEWFDRVRA